MRRLGAFGPPVLLMGVIFALSAQPSLSTGLGTWDFVVRKLAHMAEYGLLWILWWRAFDGRRPLAATTITVVYAITDEIHQTGVTGRHGTPVDVVIDALGMGVAIMLALRWWPALARRRTARAVGTRG